VLAGIMSQEAAPPAARVSAAGILLDRGWGKAIQPIAGDDGGPLRVVIRQIVDNIGEPELKVVEPVVRQLESGAVLRVTSDNILKLQKD
jgi:hypothetical protein